MESAQVDRLIEGIKHIRHCASNALEDIDISRSLTENYLKLIMLKCDEYLSISVDNGSDVRECVYQSEYKKDTQYGRSGVDNQHEELNVKKVLPGG